MKKRWVFIITGVTGFVGFLCGICFILTVLVMGLPTMEVQEPQTKVIEPTTLPAPIPDTPKEPTEEAQKVHDYTVVFFQASNQRMPGYTKFQEAAAENGIEFLVIRDRASFNDLLVAGYPDLVIYPADTWNLPEDFYLISEYVDDGGRALFFFTKRWSERPDIFLDLFEVRIWSESVINTSGEYSLKNTFPTELRSLNTFLSGTYWVLASSFVEPTQYGEGGFIESYATDQMRQVFYSTPERNVAFMLQVRAAEPNVSFFFDDNGIIYGDNQEAAVGLLKYMLEP